MKLFRRTSWGCDGRIWFGVLLCLSIYSTKAIAQVDRVSSGERYVNRIQAKEAQINKKTTEIIERPEKEGIKLLALKSGIAEVVDNNSAEPDVLFNIRVPDAGIYELLTYAIADSAEIKKNQHGGSKTFFVKIQIDQERPTKRIVYDSWNASSQIAGKFQLNGKDQQLKIWLPKDIGLAYIELRAYVPPLVPEKARLYEPQIVPPSTHPRLWMNAQTLPIIKERLYKGENQAVWAKVEAAALVPFQFAYHPLKEVPYNEELEKVAQIKAFYYLMTGDKKVGREAVQLMVRYLSVLEFGNVSYGDITREVGRAIYFAAIVYDWCYDLASKDDKKILYENMMRLAREMEIGWPPFDDSIINGHGNEAQINRDLLAMSIAVYDEDPEPYRYTSYTILEQLVPMRKFEYQSPRHNQGVDYGAYRFEWEMHAVWLFYRMSGVPVFDDNIKNLPQYWLYMRLPDGLMLRDGDVFNVRTNGKPYYWKQPQTMLLCYTYANDPLMKGEFEREGGLPDNPVLFLLVNDPGLKAERSLGTLPLTKDFGSVLGGMVARTGWNNKPSSNDVIAEIKGGGYHFGNHQHADAGALQIYYHGIQVGDIGLYLSYGPPYDFNFNKRSIAHSMMLARDPQEKLLFRTKVNDGGTRFNQRFPKTPEETISDPWFDNGAVVSTSFGPSKERPAYSYFKADLTAAYTSKMSDYTRGFCFLNLEREDVPAVIILTDDMATSKAEFKKYWQINTLKKPVMEDDNIVLHNSEDGIVGKTYVNMLVPSLEERKMDVLSGEKANSTFEVQYDVNSEKPEARAHRIMISPKGLNKRDRFLTVFQMVAEGAKPLPVKFYETGQGYVLTLANRVVGMGAGSDLISEPFTLHIESDTTYQVFLAGMKPGFWNIKSEDGQVDFNAHVVPEENTMFFYAQGGDYIISPGRHYDETDLK